MPAIACPKCSALISDTAETCYQCGVRLGKAYAVERKARVAVENVDILRTAVILMVTVYLFTVTIGVEARLPEGLTAVLTPETAASYACGAQETMTEVGRAQPWRLLTSIFVHLTPLHILFNSLMLWSLGPRVMEIYGVPKAIVLFVATGLAGSLASAVWNLPGGGASGALCGFVGVLLHYGYRRRDGYGQSLFRSMVMLTIFIALFGLVMPRVNNVAHAGGFLVGLILAPVVGWTEERLVRSQSVLAGLCMVAVVISWGLVFYYLGDNLEYYRQLFGG